MFFLQENLKIWWLLLARQPKCSRHTKTKSNGFLKGRGTTEDYLAKLPCCTKFLRVLRPRLCGVGYLRQPSTRVTLGELIFHLFLWKVQRTVYMRITNSSTGGETTRGARCPTLAGRVTLAGRTTFSHVNTLSRLRGTAFCVPRVT